MVKIVIELITHHLMDRQLQICRSQEIINLTGRKSAKSDDLSTNCCLNEFYDICYIHCECLYKSSVVILIDCCLYDIIIDDEEMEPQLQDPFSYEELNMALMTSSRVMGNYLLSVNALWLVYYYLRPPSKFLLRST